MIQVIESDECALHKVALVTLRTPETSLTLTDESGNVIVRRESNGRARVCPVCPGGAQMIEAERGKSKP